MSWGSDAKSRMRQAVRLTLNEIGRRAVTDIRQSISVPVTYVGKVAIRSDPGEPPRKEFKYLWKSIKYRVRPKATGTDDLIVFVDPKMSGPEGESLASRAMWLEYGTEYIEPRPFWEPAKERLRSVIRPLFKSLLLLYEAELAQYGTTLAAHKRTVKYYTELMKTQEPEPTEEDPKSDQANLGADIQDFF